MRNLRDWYYLSFAGPEFKGGYFIQGSSIEDAILNAQSLYFDPADPSWNCLGINITANNKPLPYATYLNRRLSKSEIQGMEVNGVKGGTDVKICADCANGPIEVGTKR